GRCGQPAVPASRRKPFGWGSWRGVPPPTIKLTDKDHPMTCHRRATVVAGFAKMVLSGAIIRPIAEGQPVSKEKHRIAEQAHSALMGDKERARKLMVAAFAHGVTTGCRMPLSARPS